MNPMLRCPAANPCPICARLIVPQEVHPCKEPELPPYRSRARIRVKLNGKRPTGIWDRDSWGMTP